MHTTKQIAYPFLFWVAALVAAPMESDMQNQMFETSAAQPVLRIESIRPKVVFPDTGRDPFDPLIKKEVPKVQPIDIVGGPAPEVTPEKLIEPPVLSIQGVVWGGTLNQAIVNGRVVKPQDTVAGVKILSIEKQGITVFFEEREFFYSSPASGGTGSAQVKSKGGSNEKN